MDGVPVFGFHGTPNSRLVHLGVNGPRRAGVRLILPDRPGLGRSDFQPGRKLLNWPSDVAELADALGIDRFAVFGVSGGGPHAVACGYALPDRVWAVGLVSAVGPAFDDAEVAAAMPSEWRSLSELARTDAEEAAARVWQECEADLGRLASDPDRWFDDWEATAPAADRAAVADHGVREMYIQSCLEATVEGYARDLMILTSLPWDFRLEDISARSIVWHGEEDDVVPMAVARRVARRLPACEPRFLPGEGHLLVHPRAEEILRTLAAGSPG